MPKQVDHAQRRELIADAVCRLAARSGLEEASLRHVATEAGVSVGQIQHYFGTKDEMLLFAFRTVSARLEQRFRTTAGITSTRAVLRTLLVAMVSADPVGRLEAPLWVAFLARAVVAPELAAPLREGSGQLAGFVADRLRAGRDAGEVATSVDPDHEATVLLALADGLMLRTLLDPEGTDAAVAALDHHLDRVFTRG